MRRVILIILTLMLFAPEAGATNKHAAHFKHTLNKFIETAKKQNPNLHEAKNRINIYKQIPDQRSSWKDPKLTLGLVNMPVDTFSFRDQAGTQKRVQLTQEIPYPGKMDLKKQAAERDVSIAKWNLKELELKIIRQVKESFYELCFINLTIET
ncbi:MAG: TolC family protein, partial [Nitrospinaceae bacterium]